MLATAATAPAAPIVQALEHLDRATVKAIDAIGDNILGAIAKVMDGATDAARNAPAANILGAVSDAIPSRQGSDKISTDAPSLSQRKAIELANSAETPKLALSPSIERDVGSVVAGLKQSMTMESVDSQEQAYQRPVARSHAMPPQQHVMAL